jgi:hypothetical protein
VTLIGDMEQIRISERPGDEGDDDDSDRITDPILAPPPEDDDVIELDLDDVVVVPKGTPVDASARRPPPLPTSRPAT